MIRLAYFKQLIAYGCHGIVLIKSKIALNPDFVVELQNLPEGPTKAISWLCVGLTQIKIQRIFCKPKANFATAKFGLKKPPLPGAISKARKKKLYHHR
jgi:hypothetical protein